MSGGEAPGGLLRVLGPGFGLAVAVGAAVGGEILRLPGPVAAALPNPALAVAVWALGGLYAALCSLAFAELGTRIPRSGGLTAFAEAGLGPFAGFLVGWADFLACAFTVGAYAMLAGDLAHDLGLPGPPRLLALGSLLLVGACQWPGVRSGAVLQDATSAAKGLLLLALGGAALLLPPVPAAPAPASGGGLIAVLGALQLVIFAYDNYYAPVYFAGEYRNPAKELPRALLGGVALVTGLYVLLAWGLSRGLSHAGLAASAFPGADLGTRLFGPAGGRLVAAILMLGLLSGMNATALIASRVLYALGAEGLAGGGALRVNGGGTPVTGLAAALAVAATGLALPSFERAVQFMSPFVLINYGLCFVALLALRRRGPGGEGVFRTPLHPWTTLLCLGGSAVLLAGSLAAEPVLGGAALLLLALSAPAFLALRRGGVLRPGGAL